MLTRQCLDRRIPTPQQLAQEVAAWVATRNRAATRIAWRFTLAARAKLAHVYPVPEQDTVALTHY